jgi:hypothetical protein
MNLGSNINFFLSLQNQLRVCHWQTKSHSRHTAFGDLYSGLDSLIDDYVEQYMGKYGRFVLDDQTSTYKLQNLKDIDVKSFCKNVAEALVQFSGELDESDTNLLNIRDEMLGLIYKTAYLLTQD